MNLDDLSYDDQRDYLAWLQEELGREAEERRIIAGIMRERMREDSHDMEGDR